MSDVIGTPRKTFPDDHKRIIALATNRVIYPMPLNSVKSWVEKTYLVRIVTEISQKSVFRSLMKRKMPVKVRKKLPLRKNTEEILKISMHNLRQYSYLRHTDPDMIKDYRELYLR
ncbi:MAG: hypothetical protein M1593_02750 [Candidatus Thermoplasmatota archaeon]|nr:hypothetical protein [Candidatus Thermoplasmatota archaeon]